MRLPKGLYAKALDGRISNFTGISAPFEPPETPDLRLDGQHIIKRFGLGQLLHFGRELNAMDQVAAVMLAIIAVGLVADRLLFIPSERYLRRTRGL